jgi:hypothetical protein
MPNGRKARIMKKIILAMTIFLMAFGSMIAQRRPTGLRRPAVKRVQVTADTVARQPASKAYILDLTRKGTAYSLASDIDYSRVRIRTSKGEKSLSELVGEGRKSSGVIVGMASDLRNLKLNLPTVSGTIAKYSCEGLKCNCTGDVDCNEMFDAGVCGDVASCDNGEGTCQCLKKM